MFDTDRGKIAILIGDDVEFPEVARIAAGKGANLLFVPFNTDIRSGYMRVRSCAQARCIENGIYAVLAGPIGNLPFVQGADIHYGEACILTPCDVAVRARRRRRGGHPERRDDGASTSSTSRCCAAIACRAACAPGSIAAATSTRVRYTEGGKKREV